MQYEVKSYQSLVGLEGLSENLLNNHFILYQGYVKNTNYLLQRSAESAKDSPEFAELRRRLGWEFNGMRLHELYFENLATAPAAIENFPDLFNKIQIDFGSIEQWREDFKAMGAMRGIGWVVLYHDRWYDRFINVWVEEHATGHLTGCRPLLVMDMFEHAYLPDNIRKPDYIENILNHFDWASADQRMKALA